MLKHIEKKTTKKTTTLKKKISRKKNYNIIIKMLRVSLNELQLIGKSGGIKGYKTIVLIRHQNQ